MPSTIRENTSSTRIPSSRNHGAPEPVAPGVAYLTVVFVNTYFIGAPEGPWILVDTGLPHMASFVRKAAEARYGVGARPEAIVLTHGHFDHAGSVRELADTWGVPVYAHYQEMPYLTGRSDYPPQDPTIGGAISFLSRFFPHTGIDLGERIQTLPDDGSVPGISGWRWLHTPGHTAGHISLFREADGVLLAGDALTTMDLDSWASQFTEQQELDWPPAPLTTDWDAARDSVSRLANLSPSIIAAGHGIPLSGPQVAYDLDRFAARFARPETGRYIAEPAHTDATGVVVALPPPVPDPLPGQLVVASALGLSAALWGRTLWEQKQNGATEKPGSIGTGTTPVAVPAPERKPRLKPLKDQVIVITGASSGIGLATARAAAQAGARVVIASRNGEALQQLESELSALSPRAEALAVVCDVTDEEQVRDLAQAAINRFGGFDTWINDAGISIYGRLEEVERTDMRQLFETNFWGVVYGSLAALEHLKNRPGGGAIINLGSALSERVIPLQGMYCSSKFAVRGFTDALRMEAEKAGYPISVTLIKPAAIDTPYTEHAKNYLSQEPKNPPPVYAPEVVAKAILHCAQVPERDMYAGGAAAGFGWMEKLMPRATDRVMEATLFTAQQKEGEPARPRGSAALYQPSGPILQERGGYEGMVRGTSAYTTVKANRNTLGLAALVAGVGVGIAAAALMSPRLPAVETNLTGNTDRAV